MKRTRNIASYENDEFLELNLRLAYMVEDFLELIRTNGKEQNESVADTHWVQYEIEDYLELNLRLPYMVDDFFELISSHGNGETRSEYPRGKRQLAYK